MAGTGTLQSLTESHIITAEQFAVNGGNLAADGSDVEFDITGFTNKANILEVLVTQLIAGTPNFTLEIWEKDASGYDPATRSDLYLKRYSRDFDDTDESDANNIVDQGLVYIDRDNTSELHLRIINHTGGTASDFNVSIRAGNLDV